ncbi:MAG: SMP-30/gluconolactonase/LRE family protein [Thermoanaerobaculia bacterium]
MSVKPTLSLVLVGALVLAVSTIATAKEKKKKKAEDQADPYAELVWPPPPDEPRIKLEAVIFGRKDVESGGSGFKKFLIGASPEEPYDQLGKPMAVAFDPEGRVLVTDWETHAIHRFDLENDVMDVLGTQSRVVLKEPMGLDVAPDGTIYVADATEAHVVAFDPEGKVKAVFGGKEDLVNPTDAALSPDGKKLYVADSKAHEIVVFDAESGKLSSRFGGRGTGEGEFHFPSALAFGPEGNLFVVDQLNARVQVVTPDGEYVDQLGDLGVGFGNLVRPKGVAVDDVGLIYVTDFAFNNFQLFDVDFTLLTFVGEGGSAPGRFQGISGIDVQGNRIAVVDQLGHRLQVFRLLASKAAE